MSHPVATTAERRAVLHRIAHAEARMLPPGWDAGLEHQFGQTLTDPKATAPLLVDVAEPDADEPCAPGLCDQHNTACVGHCRYLIPVKKDQFKRKAQQPIGLLDEVSPLLDTPTPPTASQIRALINWLLLVAVCIALAAIAIVSALPRT